MEGGISWQQENPRMFACRNSAPCDHHVGQEKMKAGDNNENAIWALPPSSLTLKTTFQQ